ncbi:putative baseplate assembly protein [Sanguibacter gelidistatuariae]|uniref:Putative baseplate assembly protein n=1 Tax=Sanguibacter gelidistatuariae TaxID=1814289 RepID=A0A1G6MY93_9MICO|nr:putative baseplate assembly protein [Sanguibacter gelidistatuariae]SDC59956.1 putative baseplate assembly protein [Sanguibacter gelidistatuariae]
MPIPAPNLDDRSFQDIVDETKRLIPRFTPEWTNHNVSDPGVALIELFAWMSEMVLFRVNQVPERLYVHFLNLVGIEQFPPSVARAILTFWLSGPATAPVRVPAGTEVSTLAATEVAGVVFTTTTEAVVVPPVLTMVHTAQAGSEAVTDGWEALTYPGTSLTCFATPGLAENDAAYFGFTTPLANLAINLTVRAHAEGIGVDPRNPPLLWEVWSGEIWIPARVQSDSTGGLNRDGAVVLLVPDQHEVLTLGGRPGYWLRARLTRPLPGQPTYQASPQIEELTVTAVGVTVAAEHASAAAAEIIGRSTGVSSQVFPVTHKPVAMRRDEEAVRVTTHDQSTAWTEVPDFSASGPQDRHVVWDSISGDVQFGPSVRYPDGTVVQHGATPPDGAQIQVTSYRYGGGAAGNVGAETLTVLRSSVPFVASVTNLAAASGGVDAESIEEAKVRGPLTLRTGERAVTAGDYERITHEASVEVARAACLPRSGGAPGAVRVLVVPQVRKDPRDHTIDDFALSTPLVTAITQALEARRLVGAAIEVGTPFYQGVSVAVLLHALPGRSAPLIRQRVLEAITRYVNPLFGGPDGTGWVFDTDLTATAIAQLVEPIEGIERIDEVQLFDYDLRNGARIGAGRDTLRLSADALFLSANHRVVVR